ncbi:hypothetical protein D1007_14534 [Hordeum vulgare]|nr:hypothetical protein D1007_14534 [Hordeum vulgare]
MAVRVLAANYIISFSPKATVRSETWMKPRYGYAKLNVDVGFDSDKLEGSVGAVLRDHHGKFIAAANEEIDICFDSFTDEAIEVRFGMNLARIAGCSKIEINSASAKVIASLIDGFSSSFASAVFEDCYFMSLDFTRVVYEHCNRERNLVAHELARIARFSTPNFWLDSAPEAVIPFIVNDANIVMNE